MPGVGQRQLFGAGGQRRVLGGRRLRRLAGHLARTRDLHGVVNGVGLVIVRLKSASSSTRAACWRRREGRRRTGAGSGLGLLLGLLELLELVLGVRVDRPPRPVARSRSWAKRCGIRLIGVAVTTSSPKEASISSTGTATQAVTAWASSPPAALPSSPPPCSIASRLPRLPAPRCSSPATPTNSAAPADDAADRRAAAAPPA